MHKTFMYRIYPTKSQQRKLRKTLAECRWVYNQTLTLRRDSWKYDRKRISLYETHNILIDWKHERPSLTSVYSQVLRDVQTRVDLAFESFFRRVKAGQKPGYPRLKGYGRYSSFTYPQHGFSFGKGKIWLSKIGEIKTKFHRPMSGEIKSLTIQCLATGKWFVCFSCVCETETLPESAAVTGIDVGIVSFATLSTGETIDNPRFYARAGYKLRKIQHKLKCLHGDRQKQAKKYMVAAKVHSRIANRRKNFAHQLSRQLVNRFGVICIEDLSVNRMIHKSCFARDIRDAAWTQFFTYLSYKAEWAGRKVIRVVPAYTSQTCSHCGHRQYLTLSDRDFCCPCCGTILNRDHNAALNILALGLQRMGTQSLEAPVS